MLVLSSRPISHVGFFGVVEGRHHTVRPPCRANLSFQPRQKQCSSVARSGSGSGGTGTHDNDEQGYAFKQQQHPVALAFLGDAVWELYVRRAAYLPPKHHSRYLATVRPHVTAEGQAAYHDWLLSRGLLTAQEASLLKWAGRKQDVRMRSRFSRTSTEATYRKATALEALVGYLHLTDQERLQSLVTQLLESGAAGSPESPLTTMTATSSGSESEADDQLTG